MRRAVDVRTGPGLSREAVVTAKQAMCTKISDESNPEVALLGELRVYHSPKPITRTKSTSITVSAKSIRENDQPIIGNVKIGGAVVRKSGTAFAHTFASGAAPASTVDAVYYKTEPINCNLVNPPPTPPPTLNMSIVNQAPSFFTITAVTWNIFKQEPSGLVLTTAATGNRCQSSSPLRAISRARDCGRRRSREWRKRPCRVPGNVTTGGVSRMSWCGLTRANAELQAVR